MAVINMAGFKCDRCEHEWVPRNEATPTVCPKCKSPYWNRERRDGTNRERKQ